jgi:hypothetical protein
MFRRDPYRSTSPAPRPKTANDPHARPLAWASAVLLVLCVARIVYGFVRRSLDGEVLFAMALASAALVLLASTMRTRDVGR